MLDRNKAERHIRGGQATLLKYRSQGDDPADEKSPQKSHKTGKRLARKRIMY